VRRGRRAGVRFVGRVPEQARTPGEWKHFVFFSCTGRRVKPRFPERAQTDAVDGRHSEPGRRPAVAGFRVVRRQTVHGAQDETADGAVREGDGVFSGPAFGRRALRLRKRILGPENDEHTGARAAGLRQNRTRAHARPALRFGVLGARRNRRQPRRRDREFSLAAG